MESLKWLVIDASTLIQLHPLEKKGDNGGDDLLLKVDFEAA